LRGVAVMIVACNQALLNAIFEFKKHNYIAM